MKEILKKIIGANSNKLNRHKWLKEALGKIPDGWRILDAGAGELQNSILCSHLVYVSQDICKYDGKGNASGLHTGNWDTSAINIVSDICEIPEMDGSFDAILCSEVFEHLPDPLNAIKEFSRLLKPGGKLIITAPFSSLVHFAPYFYGTGFSLYWYKEHLPKMGFMINELAANGDWFSGLKQELIRLPKMAKKLNPIIWLSSYLISALGILFLIIVGEQKNSSELSCFGWHCIATKL